MTDTVDIEELEGRSAYDRGEKFDAAKPDRWRRGWIERQMIVGPGRQRSLREINALRRSFEDVGRQMRGEKP